MGGRSNRLSSVENATAAIELLGDGNRHEEGDMTGPGDSGDDWRYLTTQHEKAEAMKIANEFQTTKMVVVGIVSK